jgi:hypothetical protein
MWRCVADLCDCCALCTGQVCCSTVTALSVHGVICVAGRHVAALLLQNDVLPACSKCTSWNAAAAADPKRYEEQPTAESAHFDCPTLHTATGCPQLGLGYYSCPSGVG